jgi:hypothetical protein
MSKTSALGQSIAAIFSPESQRLREQAKESAKAKGVSSGVRNALMNPKKTGESSAMQDSLGNPMSPGYEKIWDKEKEKAGAKKEDEKSRSDPNYVSTKIPPKNFVHLQTGWEKLLLTQKKVCEKARKLWTAIEAAPKYASLKRNKLLAEQKSGAASGFIVDVDAQEYMEKQAASEKEKKQEEKDVA